MPAESASAWLTRARTSARSAGSPGSGGAAGARATSAAATIALVIVTIMITARIDSGLASAKSAITTRPAPPGAPTVGDRVPAAADQRGPDGDQRDLTGQAHAYRIRPGLEVAAQRDQRDQRSAGQQHRERPVPDRRDQGEAEHGDATDPGGEAARDQTPRGREQQATDDEGVGTPERRAIDRCREPRQVRVRTNRCEKVHHAGDRHERGHQAYAQKTHETTLAI